MLLMFIWPPPHFILSQFKEHLVIAVLADNPISRTISTITVWLLTEEAVVNIYAQTTNINKDHVRQTEMYVHPHLVTEGTVSREWSDRDENYTSEIQSQHSCSNAG